MNIIIIAVQYIRQPQGIEKLRLMEIFEPMAPFIRTLSDFINKRIVTCEKRY